MDEILATVRKPAGYGPYLWVLNWQSAKGDAMSSVYSHFEDMDAMLKALEANGRKIVNWDLAVDHTRREPVPQVDCT